MPEFNYRGRDKEGHLRTGQRSSASIDTLNNELIKEGISPLHIAIATSRDSSWDKIQSWAQGNAIFLQELAIFSRQMQSLHTAGVPMVTALKQLLLHTRSRRLATALQGLIENLEKGQSLAVAMQHYPDEFSPMVVNIIQMGENTGHLSDAFKHLHEYLEFELNNLKQVKAAFRYPLFILVSIIIAIIVLNVFVIPTFSHFYSNLNVSLPWETSLLIGISNFFIHDGIYFLIFLIILTIILYRYFKTTRGRYWLDKYKLKIPIFGHLFKRIILIRFTQSLAMILNAGLPVTQGLQLVKNIIANTYIGEQVTDMQESIERGVSFTQAITQVNLFSALEIQIISVGEKNGELSPALNYIAEFHGHEIEYELKRLSDWIGPIIIAVVSVLVLIMALGVYLPIWNMVNSVH